jgi:hypothetical protein
MDNRHLFVINTNEQKNHRMATPGQLVQTMAEALGIPVETVTNYDRVLSASGMRSKTGRGRGAAKVTAGDAANLLIAILGSPVAGASVKEAANTCRVYGGMPLVSRFSTSFAKLGLPILDELPDKHTLRDALSALIDSAARGEHFRPFETLETGVNIFMNSVCRISLSSGPFPNAQIFANRGQGLSGELRSIGHLPTLLRLSKATDSAQFVYLPKSARRLPRKYLDQDLHQDRTVSYRTIRALGSLLSEPKSDTVR